MLEDVDCRDETDASHTEANEGQANDTGYDHDEITPEAKAFAAGAMVYLVATEFIPEVLETGSNLPNRGHPEVVAGLTTGMIALLPVLYV